MSENMRRGFGRLFGQKAQPEEEAIEKRQTEATRSVAEVARPVAAGVDISAYLSGVYFVGDLDKELLSEMVERIASRPGKLVVSGWGQYAKHLINLFGVEGNILAVADEEAAQKGFVFRGVPALPVEKAVALKPDFFVCAEPQERVPALGKITLSEAYDGQDVLLFPSPWSPEGTFYDPWRDSEFYRRMRPAPPPGPPSFLGETRVQFLLESLRQALHLSGDVLEVGSGQGGSGWAIARLLRELGFEKRLVLTDFFESLPRTNPEAVMCNDEIRDWFSFYPTAEVHPGNVDKDPEPMLNGNWCFIHYDAGFRANRLARCFGKLQPEGILVLDNYGNIAANPPRFDEFFKKRGHRVSTVPGTGQGWVVKHRRTNT